jgi:hypothetical protein
MINMREALQGMGLFKGYEEAKRGVSELTEERKHTKALAEVVAEQVDNTPLEADKALLREELARHNEAIKELKAAVAEAKQLKQHTLRWLFQLQNKFCFNNTFVFEYSNLNSNTNFGGISACFSPLAAFN